MQAEVAWQLIEQWQASGVPKEDLWALDALLVVGNETTDRRLTAFLRPLRLPTAIKRALDVLAQRGSLAGGYGLVEAERSRLEKPVREHATRLLDAWCTDHCLNRDQIDDRSVSELGLGNDRAVTFDFGPRQIAVRLNRDLQPAFFDHTGNKLKGFPRGAKSDDSDLATQANGNWKAIRSEIREIVAHEATRLEAAMGTGRTWTLSELQTAFLDHALLGSLAIRLVWSVAGDGTDPPVTFRFAEDGTLAGPDDELVNLAPDAAVCVGHPARFGPRLTARWGEIFGDYETLQPFDQLSRQCFVDASAHALERYPDRRVNGGELRRLGKRGWTRTKKPFNGFERRFGDHTAKIFINATSAEVSVILRIEAHDGNNQIVSWDAVPIEMSSEVRLDLVSVLATQA